MKQHLQNFGLPPFADVGTIYFLRRYIKTVSVHGSIISVNFIDNSGLCVLFGYNFISKHKECKMWLTWIIMPMLHDNLCRTILYVTSIQADFTLLSFMFNKYPFIDNIANYRDITIFRHCRLKVRSNYTAIALGADISITSCRKLPQLHCILS